MATGNFCLHKVLLVNGKVHNNTWFAVRANAAAYAKAKGYTNYSVTNGRKAVKQGLITQAQLNAIIAKVCNGGKGVSVRVYNRIMATQLHGKPAVTAAQAVTLQGTLYKAQIAPPTQAPNGQTVKAAVKAAKSPAKGTKAAKPTQGNGKASATSTAAV